MLLICLSTPYFSGWLYTISIGMTSIFFLKRSIQLLKLLNLI
jgi:hypothetical protein